MLLTYMATILDAISSKLIDVFQLPSWEVRMPIRELYVANEFMDWVDSTSRLHSESVGPRTLGEHLEQALCDFRCSEPVPVGELRRMMPTKHGVWKMHPPGLRVYGWCPAKHAFVAVTAAFEGDTKADKNLNEIKLKYVQSFIDKGHLENTVLRGDASEIFP
jgi:hypothetical protein